MTQRLYYDDSYLTAFDSAVASVEEDGRRVYLEQTAFYPDSGGQPHDLGTMNGIEVIDVIDEGERIAHVLEKPLRESRVSASIDWQRRLDHMQQHSGQHLLSAVFAERFEFQTLSFHLGAESSTIDLETPALSLEEARSAEAAANTLIRECHPLSCRLEDASTAAGLRKASEREGLLRIVSIEELDRSACGGTHVRSTGEIGVILIRKLEKIRGNVRLEFLCGQRAVRQARADYEALSAAARAFSSPLEEVPALIAALQEQAKDSDKARRKLVVELAGHRGAALYAATPEDPTGLRRHVERLAGGSFDDELKALAQGFIAAGRGLFCALSTQPPAVLLAASASSGIDAGKRLKELLVKHGGRGGGNAQLAQGSLPAAEAVQALLDELLS